MTNAAFADRYDKAQRLYLQAKMDDLIADPSDPNFPKTLPDYVARYVAPAGSPIHRRVTEEYQRREALDIQRQKAEQARLHVPGAAADAAQSVFMPDSTVPGGITAPYIRAATARPPFWSPRAVEFAAREEQALIDESIRREQARMLEPVALPPLPARVVELARNLTASMPPGAILYPEFIQRALGGERNHIWARALMELGWTPRRITKEHMPRSRVWQAPGGPAKRDRGSKAWQRMHKVHE
jgi:hypothetical protein